MPQVHSCDGGTTVKADCRQHIPPRDLSRSFIYVDRLQPHRDSLWLHGPVSLEVPDDFSTFLIDSAFEVVRSLEEQTARLVPHTSRVVHHSTSHADVGTCPQNAQGAHGSPKVERCVGVVETLGFHRTRKNNALLVGDPFGGAVGRRLNHGVRAMGHNHPVALSVEDGRSELLSIIIVDLCAVLFFTTLSPTS